MFELGDSGRYNKSVLRNTYSTLDIDIDQPIIDSSSTFDPHYFD